MLQWVADTAAAAAWATCTKTSVGVPRPGSAWAGFFISDRVARAPSPQNAGSKINTDLASATTTTDDRTPFCATYCSYCRFCLSKAHKILVLP